MTGRTTEALIAEWSATIPDRIAHARVPGLAVGIVAAGGPVWMAGFGTTERDGGWSVTPQTRFSVQSTSKLMTATAVLIAQQQGLVDLDRPLRDYLPEFTVHSAYEADPVPLITLRHLLTHTAGFTHEAPDGSNFDVGSGDFAAHCRSIYGGWLRSPVGHHYEYSNLGIDLAGYAVSRASDRSFAAYAGDELFAPLGMTRSTFDAVEVVADRERAVGHWGPFERAGQALPVAVPMVAAGGCYTTVEDALRYVQFHLRGGENLLDPGVLAEHTHVPRIDRDQRTGYGLGLYVDMWEPGVAVHHHGGSGFGFQCQLCWLPEAGLGAVVLTNSFDHALHDELAREFARRLGPATVAATGASTVRSTAPADAAALACEYVGRFDQVRVEVADGVLNVAGAPATFQGPRRVAAGTETYRFDDATDRSPAGYLVRVSDGYVRYRNAAPVEGTLDPAYVGHWVAHSWGVPTARWRMRQAGASPVIESDDGPALALTPLTADRWITSTGEILDLTGPLPRFANVELHPDRRAS